MSAPTSIAVTETERAEVFFYAANGHGGWEAVIANLVAGGLGPLHGRAFRIGHLGDMNEAMLLGCLAGVQAAMRAEGIACGARGVDAAIATLLA